MIAVLEGLERLLDLSGVELTTLLFSVFRNGVPVLPKFIESHAKTYLAVLEFRKQVLNSLILRLKFRFLLFEGVLLLFERALLPFEGAVRFREFVTVTAKLFGLVPELN